MAGFAEAIKYFYTKFILRDLLAYVTPGAVVLATALFVKSGSAEAWLALVEKLPSLAYLVLFGLSFAVGFALQNFGEMVGILKWNYEISWFQQLFGSVNTYKNDKSHLKRLHLFHESAKRVAAKPDNESKGEPADDWDETTRERISVKKNMSGTNALAIGIVVVLLIIANCLSRTCVDIALVVLTIGILIGLIRGHYKQLFYQHVWEGIVIDRDGQKVVSKKPD